MRNRILERISGTTGERAKAASRSRKGLQQQRTKRSTRSSVLQRMGVMGGMWYSKWRAKEQACARRGHNKGPTMTVG
jgi:hypothetical protein